MTVSAVRVSHLFNGKVNEVAAEIGQEVNPNILAASNDGSTMGHDGFGDYTA